MEEKLTLKQKIIHSLIAIALCGLTVFIGMYIILIMLSKLERRPIEAVCTNLPEQIVVDMKGYDCIVNTEGTALYGDYDLILRNLSCKKAIKVRSNYKQHEHTN